MYCPLMITKSRLADYSKTKDKNYQPLVMLQTKKIMITLLLAALMLSTGMAASPMLKNKGNISHKQHTIYISGHYSKDLKQLGSVNIRLWKELFSTEESDYTPHRSFNAAVKNGSFSIEIDSVEEVSYISLSGNKNKWGTSLDFLSFYLVQPGDNIRMNISKRFVAKPVNTLTEKGDSICVNCINIKFSGKGANKYNCRSEMDEAKEEAIKTFESKATAKEYERIKYFENQGLKIPQQTVTDDSQNCQEEINYIKGKSMDVLHAYRSKISGDVYQIMRASLIGQVLDQFYARPMYFNLHSPGLEGYKKWYKKFNYNNSNGISDMIALKAVYFADFLIDKSWLESGLFSAEVTGFDFQTDREAATYHLIKSKYQGQLKDKLLLTFLMEKADSSPLIEDGLNTIKTNEYRELLDAIKTSNQVGTKAYNFSLPDSTGKNVTLDSFKGKVVFIDFWFTGCKGCTQYYTEGLSKVEEDYKHNSDIVFISISIDVVRSKWVKSIYSLRYTSPTVINLYKANASPIIKQFFVNSFPHSVLIDKNGLIFSNSSAELRERGIVGLEDKINQALTIK